VTVVGLFLKRSSSERKPVDTTPNIVFPVWRPVGGLTPKGHLLVVIYWLTEVVVRQTFSALSTVGQYISVERKLTGLT
jgi:hypothetical protein